MSIATCILISGHAVGKAQSANARRSPDGVAPAILVTAQIALHGPDDVQATLLPALLGALVPWAMTHHHATRTFALLVLQVRATPTGLSW